MPDHHQHKAEHLQRQIYSQAKAAWHLDRIEALRAGRVPAPVHVQLILSDLCNHNCNFCAYRRGDGLSSELFADKYGNTNPNRQITTLKALEIVKDCAAIGVKAIQFTGGGEPTVHKEHLTVFAAAQKAGIRTALVTNGVNLRLHPANLAHDWIRVSVDAGTEATYIAVREVPPQHWKRVWANIAAIASSSYAGNLSVGFVATNENHAELALAARLAKDAGASSIRVGAVFTGQGDGYYTDIAAVRASIAAAVEEHHGFVIDLFDRRLADLHDGHPTDPFCGYQYFTTYIGADLSVYRCCNTAYTTPGKIGTLNGHRFAELAMRPKPFDARGCRYCQFNGQNRAINALLNEPGDPARLAQVVLMAVDADNPPFRLLVGASGFESVQAKLDKLKRDMDDWRVVSSDTAYRQA